MLLARPYFAYCATLLIACTFSAVLLTPHSALSDECTSSEKIGQEQAKDPLRIMERMAVAGKPDLRRSGADILVSDSTFKTLNLKLPCLDLPQNQQLCCMKGFNKERNRLREEIENLIDKKVIPNDPNLQLCMDQYERGKSFAENQDESSGPLGGSCSSGSSPGESPSNLNEIENPACYAMGYHHSLRLTEADSILKRLRIATDRTSKPLTPISPSPTGTPEPNASGAK